MALIRSFTQREMDRTSLHDEIEARYSSFEYDGRQLLQIDTYGRKSRQRPDQKSQSIQLDREGAIALLNLIRREFNL